MKPRGFTLLETLIGVLLVGMILAALHSGLWVGVQAYRRGQETARRQGVFTASEDLLARDLGRLQPQREGADPSLILRPLDDGGFWLRLACQPRPGPDATPLVVDYFFMPGAESSGRLCRRVESAAWEWQAPGALSQDTVQYELLVGDLTSATVRAFDGETWLEEWEPARMQRLPDLLELRLESEGSGPNDAFAAVMPVYVQQSLLPWGYLP